MNLPRIIGITGYAQHGKDTVAAVLVRELGYSRIALGDKLKEAVHRLDPYIADDNVDIVRDLQGGFVQLPARLSVLLEFCDPETVKALPEVRRLYQLMGTEVGRQLLGEDTWIGALGKEPGVYGSTRKVVIPDIRFPNEAKWVRRMNGEIWKVERPGFTGGIPKTHESERLVSAISPDYVFLNADSRERLQDNVFRYLKNRIAKADVVV